MTRPASPTPKVIFRAYLPMELKARLDLALFSPLEGRVPLGDYSAFLEARVREHFEWASLDLTAFGMPEGFFVRGPKGMIEWLRDHLKGPSE